MIAIIFLFGLLVVFYIVDRKIDLTDEVKLRILYLLVNSLVFITIQSFYYKLVTESIIDIDIFMNFKRIYLVLSILALLGLAGYEIYLSKSVKTTVPIFILVFVFILNLVWLPVIMVFFPVLGAIFITKHLVSLLYSNIKINYLSYFKRFNINGLDTLIFKDLYNKRFYKGDYFKCKYLNMLFTFFSSGYLDKSDSRIVVYPTREMLDHINIDKIINKYKLKDQPSLISFNSINLSILNKYQANDIFQLEEASEIADEKIFRNYLAGELLKYPKVDFLYKLYVIDFDIVQVTEDFRLFTINHYKVKDKDIVKDVKVKMCNLKSDNYINQYLHSLSMKDIIYNEIVDYFSRDGDNIYSLNRTEEFFLKYDIGAKRFNLYSKTKGLLGYLDPEKMREVSSINLPLDDDLSLEFEGYLRGRLQKYLLCSGDCIDPYYLICNFLVQVDLTNAEKLKRPEFSLYSNIKLRLNV